MRLLASMVVGVEVAGLLQGGPAAPQESVNATIGEAVRQIEQLDALRSSLAGAFGERGLPADRETFRQVCRPVGARARDIAQRNGWTVQQLAAKNRNPANALDDEAAGVAAMMTADPGLGGLWRETSMNGQAGIRYFRRIVVEPACLACHGEQSARPDFVLQGYPNDRAYGFAVGDLRGLYAVFVPHTD